MGVAATRRFSTMNAASPPLRGTERGAGEVRFALGGVGPARSDVPDEMTDRLGPSGTTPIGMESDTGDKGVFVKQQRKHYVIESGQFIETCGVSGPESRHGRWPGQL